MAKPYRVTPFVRFVNRMMRFMVRLGIAPPHTYVLTVKGRKSGKLYSTPVSLVEEGGRRWLVSPYGEVNWVRNARVAGEVALSLKGRSETVLVSELGVEERAPIIKKYLQREDFVRPYFDVAPDAPLEDFAALASKHPVFLIQTGD